MKFDARTLFFDVNETLLDLTPVKEGMCELFSGRQDLVELWFSRLLHYSLVVTVAEEYRPFEEIAVAAASMIVAERGLGRTQKEIERALAPMSELPAHADTEKALEQLGELGFRRVAFSNSSRKSLTDKLAKAGIEKHFESVVSVEEFEQFKPHRAAYDGALRRLGTSAPQSAMIACHAWDVAGAAWAGWQTVFVRRGQSSLFGLAPTPTLEVEDLSELIGRLGSGD